MQNSLRIVFTDCISIFRIRTKRRTVGTVLNFILATVVIIIGSRTEAKIKTLCQLSFEMNIANQTVALLTSCIVVSIPIRIAVITVIPVYIAVVFQFIDIYLTAKPEKLQHNTCGTPARRTARQIRSIGYNVISSSSYLYTIC